MVRIATHELLTAKPNICSQAINGERLNQEILLKGQKVRYLRTRSRRKDQREYCKLQSSHSIWALQRELLGVMKCMPLATGRALA